MATTLHHAGPTSRLGPHSAGIFADMTVDGPEIGTLVLVVDRAKNLPNRKTMGKQNPYCAARLGKEAKKTETDRRGGQTPKWDQELRFTVHDSLDYHQLKISVFSEDKRTDLIGEAWVSLKDVIIPGGGKGDLWQGLNCKGKYAGELRIELTFYDSRPKPEGSAESSMASEEVRQSVAGGSGRVKRRPLPNNPHSAHVTSDSIPGLAVPGRAKHGPREFRTPPRANSMPPEMPSYPPMRTEYENNVPSHSHSFGSSPIAPMVQMPSDHQFENYRGAQYGPSHGEEEYRQPDFLPEIPPSNRQRAQYGEGATRPILAHPYPRGLAVLPHSNSAPIIPQVHSGRSDDGLQLSTENFEQMHEYDHHYHDRRRRSDVVPSWQHEYADYYADQQHDDDDGLAPPPPPPLHSNSAPAVPLYSLSYAHGGSSPNLPSISSSPNARHHSVPTVSPLQSIERTYGVPNRSSQQSHGHPSRGSSMDTYTPSPVSRPLDSSPRAQSNDNPSPFAPSQAAARPMATRNAITDPYSTTTPSRVHPLAQELPHSLSPQPYYPQTQSYQSPPQPIEYRNRDAAPLVRPQAISPRTASPTSQPNSTPRTRSAYSIQHPVRAFESSDASPLSTSRRNLGSAPSSNHSTPLRKTVSSLSPRPTTAGGITPFSPDSFDVHNPNARPYSLPTSTSPHTPFQIRPGDESSQTRDRTNGPIVGWHGQEIDPSDHLPVDSWAPEPEQKIPTKNYGMGRDRDFGPRTVQSAPGSRTALSKDTVVNVRLKSQEDSSPSRNRLQKYRGNTSSSSSSQRSPAGAGPLRELDNYNDFAPVPDPYADLSEGRAIKPRRSHGGYGGFGGNGPTEALTREISRIDIGTSGRNSRNGAGGGGMPAPVAYVPVRSHKDRNTFY